MSRGQFQPRTQSGKKPLERRRDKNICDNVVIIDVLESSIQKSKRSGTSRPNRKHPSRGIMIIIDDDENGDVDIPRNSDKGGDIDSDATSSKIFQHIRHQPEDPYGDECQMFVRERICPFKLSKCTTLFPQKGLSRNHFGLFNEAESSTSESGNSDCELMEGSSGEIRKQWERASRKQKLKGVWNAPVEVEDRASASGSNTDPGNPWDENASRDVDESDASDANNTKHEDLSSCAATASGIVDEVFLTPEMNNPITGSDGQLSGTAVANQTVDEVNHGNANVWDREESIRGGHSPCNSQPQDEPGAMSLTLYDKNDDGKFQNNLIGEREKLKETAEYRLAEEEEWACRLRELQIQAEEAQRLRKRKKAENLRLLEMERRQKQRLEEMRETQKKDEETINLKEQLRLEIRNDLDKLELKVKDMASLLRALGIHVDGGLCPMPREVNAAYKQSLLRFHPDRASRCNIRQQVEAEETFKLISRLKDKLLPTT